MKIIEVHNVFLTRSGIGMKHFRLVKETVHQYKGKQWHFYKYALFQFFFRKTINLKGEYFVIHNHWCPGYYHWLTEALPRLLRISNQVENRTLVLPESFREKLLDSVTPLFNGKIFWIPERTNLRVDRLLIPENPPSSGVYDAAAVRLLRKIYQKEFRKGQQSANRKVYVSRRKSKRRKVVNEPAVIELMEKNGFSIVDFEDCSFGEQVNLMSNTKLLISIHGAGLANILFMNTGATVLELQKEVGSTEESVDRLYKDLALALEVTYHVLFCKPAQVSENLYEADIIVDLEQLKLFLHPAQ